jgi:hypothetical protein
MAIGSGMGFLAGQLGNQVVGLLIANLHEIHKIRQGQSMMTDETWPIQRDIPGFLAAWK